MRKYIGSLLVILITMMTLIAITSIKPASLAVSSSKTMTSIDSTGNQPADQIEKAYNQEKDDSGRFIFDY